MSYSLVELEISRLAGICLAARNGDIVDPDDLSEAGYAVEDLFASIQSGLEAHIEECRGVVEALRDAREKLSQ